MPAGSTTRRRRRAREPRARLATDASPEPQNPTRHDRTCQCLTIDRVVGSGNADPAELAKFSALAHRWWDPQSEFKPLHDINPLRLGWIERVAGGLAGKRVADVGCGGGILAEAMAARGAQVTGIDLSEKAIGVARLHQYESGIAVDYRLVAAETLALEMPGAFDVVTCMEMLEHVPEPASTVAACARAGEARRHRRLLDHQPQSEIVRAGDPRRRIRAAPAAARHARLDALPAAVRARRLRRGARGCNSSR